jgi:hypothetical protein
MNDKKKKFIKVMVSEKLYKKIDRYSHLELQTKSEFIRSAVRKRIAEINKSIYPNKTDPPFKNDGILRRDIIKELKTSQYAHEKGSLLKKPSEQELKKREKMLQERKNELENELKNIEKALKK